MSTVIKHGLRRRWAFLCLGLLTLSLPACEWDGHFTVLGYTTRPNYDCDIHTVYVPIFKNLTYYRGLEFELTKAIVREIETKTPYKVVSDRDRADTELSGMIVGYTKSILNRNQLNEVREAQTTLTVQVTWLDLHSGEVLSQPRKPGQPPPIYAPAGAVPIGGPLDTPITSAPTQPVTTTQPAADNRAGSDTLPAPTPLPDGTLPPPGSIPAPGPPPPGPPFVIIQSIGHFVPEIGGSITTSMQQNVDRLAVQVVSMMEKPW